MPQLVPAPYGSYPYPKAGGQDIKMDVLGNLGKSIGDSMGIFSDSVMQHRMMDAQKAKSAQQNDFLNMTIDQFKNMMQPQQPQPMAGPMQPSGSGPVRGPAGYRPPNQGPQSSAIPAGMTPPQPRPMIQQTMSPQMTMRTLALINQISPSLSKRVSDMLMPPPAKLSNRLPPEQYWIDPNTGEPSLKPKNGFIPQMGQPGSGARALTQWHYRKVLEGDKDARLHLSKTIADSRIADGVNKAMMPVDNAMESYKSLLALRNKMSKKSLDRAQDIMKNPNPNLLVSMFRTNDPDATNYYNALMSSKNALKGIAMNKLAGTKDLQDLAHLLPDGSEDAKGLKNKMMAFNRAADLIRARTLATARVREARLSLGQEGQVEDLMGLPSIGDLEIQDNTSDFSDVDKDLGT